MSFHDVYIGDLDDPNFRWQGGNWEGNCPRALSPFFPPGTPSGPGNPFWALIEKLNKKQFEGKQSDWGAWVAKVNKEQIETFIDEVYGTYEQPEPLAHLRKRFNELKAFVATLDHAKTYALVATEL
jgi:hypothetical protein